MEMNYWGGPVLLFLVAWFSGVCITGGLWCLFYPRGETPKPPAAAGDLNAITQGRREGA